VPIDLSWVKDNITQVALLIVMGIGVLIILGSRKSRWGDNLSTLGIVLLGLIFIAVPAALLAAARGTGTSLFGGG
jgi:hypothetical protein